MTTADLLTLTALLAAALTAVVCVAPAVSRWRTMRSCILARAKTPLEIRRRRERLEYRP